MDIKKVYLLHHPQYPNSVQKKFAIRFIDKEGEGYDVYDYNEDIEYINIEGQYPTSIGPAHLKNIEKIHPTVQEMISLTDRYHNFSFDCTPIAVSTIDSPRKLDKKLSG